MPEMAERLQRAVSVLQHAVSVLQCAVSVISALSVGHQIHPLFLLSRRKSRNSRKTEILVSERWLFSRAPARPRILHFHAFFPETTPNQFNKLIIRGFAWCSFALKNYTKTTPKLHFPNQILRTSKSTKNTKTTQEQVFVCFVAFVYSDVFVIIVNFGIHKVVPHFRKVPPHDRKVPPHDRKVPPHDRKVPPHDRKVPLS